MTIKEAEKVECLLNCPNCGKEILDEDASFCPKCGKSLAPEDEIQQKRTDLVLAAAMLTIIAAAFSAGLGYIALYQYNYWFSIYGSSAPPQILGFLIFGIVDIIASAFAIAGATFMLKRKRIKVTMLGVILLLVSAVVTYIIIDQNGLLEPITVLGFTDTLLFSEISILIFLILSGVLIFASKTEFA